MNIRYIIIDFTNLTPHYRVILFKIIESMGIPILIAVPDGEATQIISDASSSIIKVENNDDITYEIITLLDNPLQLEDYQKNSYLAAESYSRKNLAIKMVNAMKKLTNS